MVVVLLDDTGFAQFGCYRVRHRHATMSMPSRQVALQYTNFHVTPLCSPTRAASLLTGRSQHAVGMRGVSNWRTGFPNQLGHISNHAATIAEVLQDAGVRHLLRSGSGILRQPMDISAAGPFDQWPLASVGFDRFYGFLEGETDQFTPSSPSTITSRTTGGSEDGYHVSEDMIDQLVVRCSATARVFGPTGRSSPMCPSVRPMLRTRRPSRVPRQVQGSL